MLGAAAFGISNRSVDGANARARFSQTIAKQPPGLDVHGGAVREFEHETAVQRIVPRPPQLLQRIRGRAAADVDPHAIRTDGDKTAWRPEKDEQMTAKGESISGIMKRLPKYPMMQQ
jgi:hypothetical protein